VNLYREDVLKRRPRQSLHAQAGRRYAGLHLPAMGPAAVGHARFDLSDSVRNLTSDHAYIVDHVNPVGHMWRKTCIDAGAVVPLWLVIEGALSSY